MAEYKAEPPGSAELDEGPSSSKRHGRSLHPPGSARRVQVAGRGLRREFRRIKVELAQIAECLSVRGFLGSFKAKLAEFAENPICKAALAAGRAFENARRQEGGEGAR